MELKRRLRACLLVKVTIDDELDLPDDRLAGAKLDVVRLGGLGSAPCLDGVVSVDACGLRLQVAAKAEEC